MKTYNSSLGPVQITDAKINRSHGYGQYKIEIDFMFSGKNHRLRLHSTDSQLFDAAHGEPNHAEIVLDQAQGTIENAIDDLINSLD